jgi:hypothetical protein
LHLDAHPASVRACLELQVSSVPSQSSCLPSRSPTRTRGANRLRRSAARSSGRSNSAGAAAPIRPGHATWLCECQPSATAGLPQTSGPGRGARARCSRTWRACATSVAGGGSTRSETAVAAGFRRPSDATCGCAACDAPSHSSRRRSCRPRRPPRPAAGVCLEVRGGDRQRGHARVGRRRRWIGQAVWSSAMCRRSSARS